MAAASESHDLIDVINDPSSLGDDDIDGARREEEDGSEGELEMAEEDGNITDAVASVCKQHDLK